MREARRTVTNVARSSVAGTNEAPCDHTGGISRRDRRLVGSLGLASWMTEMDWLGSWLREMDWFDSWLTEMDWLGSWLRQMKWLGSWLRQMEWLGP